MSDYIYSLQPQGQQSDCHCSDNFGRSITTKQVTRRAEVSYKLIDVKVLQVQAASLYQNMLYLNQYMNDIQ